MTAEEIAKIEQRWAAATPGPWIRGNWNGTCNRHKVGEHPGLPECKYDYELSTNGIFGECVSLAYSPENLINSCHEYCTHRPEDMEAIAHAPKDIAYLIAEVRRLSA